MPYEIKAFLMAGLKRRLLPAPMHLGARAADSQPADFESAAAAASSSDEEVYEVEKILAVRSKNVNYKFKAGFIENN